MGKAISSSHANMHVEATAIPQKLPAQASQKITQGDFTGLDFLEKRETDRLINAADFTNTQEVPELFQKGGLRHIPQLIQPLLSNPDGSIRTAKSHTYLSISPQEDGRTKWQIIARPMAAQIEPFYFSEGFFTAEDSARIKESTSENLAQDDIDLFMDTLLDDASTAAAWGAVAFEKSLAQ